MISFTCSSCNRIITVDQKYSGKKGKCPKCGGIVVVPGQSTVIVFQCESCGHKIKVPDKYGGKKGKCPKCHEPVIMPTIKKDKTVTKKMVSVICQICGQNVEVPEETSEAFFECPSCGAYVETSLEGAEVESYSSIPSPTNEDPYEDESEEYDESGGIDRRLIIIIFSIAAVVVLGLIILVVTLKLSRPQRQLKAQVAVDTPESRTETYLKGQMGVDFEGAKAFAKQYIRLLESGDIDEAYKHHGPELAKEVYRFSFEKLSERIGSSRIVDMDCTQVQSQQYPGENKIMLSYDLVCEQGTQSVDMVVLSSGPDFKVKEISAKDSRGYSIMLGISTSGLPPRSRTTTSPQRARPSSGKVFTAIITGFAVGTFFSAVCLWIGMKITRVEGTFITMLGIAAISSLANIIPSFFCIIPCVGLLFNIVIMVVLICKWTDADLWPEAIGIVIISGFVGVFSIRLLNFIISMA